MSLYVLCVLGGMALLACGQFVWHYIRERRLDRRWERQRGYGIYLDGPPAPTSITNNRVHNWRDPAVKGFQRGGQ